MDLLTRGAGFGYLGSTVTSLIYASFTFIFFALEAAIMALALQLVLDWPLVWCYVLSSLVIIPMVLHGITFISRLQTWTQPLWVVLLLLALRMVRAGPARFLRAVHGPVRPDLGQQRLRAADVRRRRRGDLRARAADRRAGGLPALHACTHPANRWRWWGAVLVAGPGWILPGMLKMLGGAFLAFVALQYGTSPLHAAEPTQMYLVGYLRSLSDPTAALLLTVLFVVISQVKINVTNAYAGSTGMEQLLRAAHAQPPGPRGLAGVQRHHRHAADDTGRLRRARARAGPVRQRGHRLGGRAGRRPGHQQAAGPESQGRGVPPRLPLRHQPRGPGCDGTGRGARVVAHFGWLGEYAAAFAPFIALFTAMVTAPLLAWATWGATTLRAAILRPGRSVNSCAAASAKTVREHRHGCLPGLRCADLLAVLFARITLP